LNVEDGIVERGQILVNTRENHQDVRRRFGRDDVATYTVDATGIALSILGRPVSNTAMLGALVRVAPYVSLESTLRATAERFPGPLAEKNEQVIRRAYEEVKGY